MFSAKMTFLTITAASLLAFPAAVSSQPEPVVYGGEESGPIATMTLSGDPMNPAGYVASVYEYQSDSLTKGCGQKVRGVKIKFESYTKPFPITLWTYRMLLDFSWCNYKVTKVNRLWDEPVDTCCNWEWKGNIVRTHTPVGQANLTAYTKANFRGCALFIVFCKDRFPSAQITVNGNGLRTSFQWSAG